MGSNRGTLPEIKIKAKSVNQQKYLDAIDTNYITFGIGPAGCGKTFLAMLTAMKYFSENRCSTIVLARPAVEAGEKLGFLPGSYEEKLAPYMEPLYDVAQEFWQPMRIEEMIAKQEIIITPIAYLRGRTFRNSFIVIDEAQNMTIPQLKMAMTRFGEDSKMVINGDSEQSDLPRVQQGSLTVARKLVDYGITGVDMVEFDNAEDCQRHPVVRDVTDTWDKIIQ